MAYSNTMREEEVKNRLRQDYFKDYDASPILGNIDFAVAVPTDGQQLFETEYLLWAEAKEGARHDIHESFVQLILTIGKARTFDRHLPPAFLGAFDAEKIAFIPYYKVLDVFSQTDFNWNVTPSDHQSKEFRQLLELVSHALDEDMTLFHYAADDRELRHFIRQNFIVGKSELSKVRISKNNFTAIYQKWRKEVKPSINIDWDIAKKAGIIDSDFYLADILSKDNATLKDKLYVLLRSDHYVLDRRINDTGLKEYKIAEFHDEQKAHRLFWNRYDRPPRREYWDYIIGRRDLLVPQDVRERKGSYFTPQRWVELSQEYIARELGDDWQDEYTVWDCCAGTGNLLVGLTNKYNIYASTLDQADVDVMHDRIHNGANLLDSHVFQFDFLNDPFTKLPQPLQDIINDPERRKRLLIYINPPYAEAGNRKVIANGGEGEYKQKTNVAVTHLAYKKYLSKIGIAGRELFAQFIMRVYDEIPSSVLAQFSTLKIEQAPNFRYFRDTFRAKLGRNFLVPANTFDNVTGDFPIGFFIWHTDQKERFTETVADVYNEDGELIGHKTLCAFDEIKSINDWMIETRQRPNEMKIGYMSCRSHDFSNVNYNFIMNDKSQMKSPRGSWVTDKNVREACIYIAVCHCIPADWLNDRDQFLYPNDGWQTDYEFQSDCFVYTLFNNNIQSKYGANHWIPFTEQEVDAKEKFKSHFMVDYMERGHSCPRPTHTQQQDLFEEAATLPDTTTGMSLLHTNTIPIAEFMERGHSCPRPAHTQQQDRFEEAATSPDTTSGMSLLHTNTLPKAEFMERGHSCPRPAHTQQQDRFTDTTTGMSLLHTAARQTSTTTTTGMSLLHTDDVGAATLLSPTNYNDAIASFDQSCAIEDAGRQECRPSHDEDRNVLAPYIPREHFSDEAKAVMDAGRELWRYYHAQPHANPDASYYDIRLFFQGTKVTASGKTQMNPDSPDAHYTALITELRRNLKALARHIEPKVYLYGFLKR